MSSQNVVAKLCALALTLFLVPTAFSVIDVGRFPAPDGSFTLEVKTDRGEGDKIPLGRLVNLNIKIVGPEGFTLPANARLNFDARMPGHDHGMVVKPKVRRLEDGSFLVEGVKLHMEGDWELRFDVDLDGRKVALRVPYKL